MESSDRINEHTEDARRMGIEVLPPDVNASDVEFSVVGEAITFGLGAIKGVGEAAVGAIVEERTARGPFRDIFDLTERVDPKVLTKGMLEILIKAGALDSLSPNKAAPNRAQLMEAVDRAAQAAAARMRDKAAGQKNLFGGDEPSDAEEASFVPTLPDIPDWPKSQKLAFEKEVFGFFLTSHPIAEAGERITRYATHTNNQLADCQDGEEVMLGGMVGSIKKAQTKKPSRNGHTRYVNFDFEDETGIVRCIMWPEEFTRQGELVQQEAILYLRGKVDRRGREPNVIVNKLMTLDEADKEFTKQLAIRFQRGLHAESELVRVREILDRFPGETDVIVVVDSADPHSPSTRLRYQLSPPQRLRVTCSANLRKELAAVVGDENLSFIAPGVKKNGNGRTNGNGSSY